MAGKTTPDLGRWYVLPPALAVVANAALLWILSPRLCETCTADVGLWILSTVGTSLLVAVYCVVCWGGRSGWRLVFSILVVPISFGGVMALERVEINYLTWRFMENPPPRPMFHVMSFDERNLLPRWRMSFAIDDASGNRAWCETPANFVLIVQAGEEQNREFKILPDINKTTLCFGTGAQERRESLALKENTLVVAALNGGHERILLAARRGVGVSTTRGRG